MATALFLQHFVQNVEFSFLQVSADSVGLLPNRQLLPVLALLPEVLVLLEILSDAKLLLHRLIIVLILKLSIIEVVAALRF